MWVNVHLQQFASHEVWLQRVKVMWKVHKNQSHARLGLFQMTKGSMQQSEHSIIYPPLLPICKLKRISVCACHPAAGLEASQIIIVEFGVIPFLQQDSWWIISRWWGWNAQPGWIMSRRLQPPYCCRLSGGAHRSLLAWVLCEILSSSRCAQHLQAEALCGLSHGGELSRELLPLMSVINLIKPIVKVVQILHPWDTGLSFWQS